MGSQIYIMGLCAPCTTPRGNIFVPEASTLLCLMAILISEILGGPKFTLGGTVPPVRPRAENFLYPRRVRYYV